MRRSNRVSKLCDNSDDISFCVICGNPCIPDEDCGKCRITLGSDFADDIFLDRMRVRNGTYPKKKLSLEEKHRFFGFIRSPRSVELMIKETKQQRPALVGIVKELEAMLDCIDHPTHFRSEIGWVIARVMEDQKYVKHSTRHKVEGAKIFTEATLYRKNP